MKLIISLAILFMVITGGIGLGLLDYYYEPTIATCEELLETEYDIAVEPIARCTQIMVAPEVFYWSEGYLMIIYTMFLVGCCGGLLGYMIEDTYF